MKAKRDIGVELLRTIQDIEKVERRVVKIENSKDIVTIRKQLYLTQGGFAWLIGVSVHTLQKWEQGRQKPNGAAISLLKIAKRYPRTFFDLRR